MPKAIWNEAVLVESDDTVMVDGDVYFPIESVNSRFLKKSTSTSTSPQKGKAFFYDVVVEDKVNRDAAWYYLNPEKEYGQLKNRIAFWKGVELTNESDVSSSTDHTN
ncbi:DUF427 domain-containing protein [Gimesia sp.]|uniref:DUF427 domain-containing protein n=1 Tax=Gimesia sp. TaxID=2024833 RepID=UPI0032ED6B0A